MTWNIPIGWSYGETTNGDPEKNFPVQYLSAWTMDAEGTVSFHAENDRYTVHVQRVPEGFDENTQEYAVPEDLSDVEIILKKAG